MRHAPPKPGRLRKYVRHLLNPAKVLEILHARWKTDRFERFYDAAFSNVESGSLVVRMDDLDGTFEIDFRSHILQRILIWKTYEPELIQLAKQHVDLSRDVLDVGANVGLYTVLFAKQLEGRRVLAIEPAPLPHQYLLRNLRRNDCAERVIVFNGISTEQRGTYRLNVIPGREEYASLGGIVHPAIRGQAFQEVEVEGETIDALVRRFDLAPGFMKIDTEGAEFSVLSGAAETLRTFRPVVLSELSDRLMAVQGRTAAAAVELLQSFGYEVQDVVTRRLPVYPFEGNVLAVPRSPAP